MFKKTREYEIREVVTDKLCFPWFTGVIKQIYTYIPMVKETTDHGFDMKRETEMGICKNMIPNYSSAAINCYCQFKTKQKAQGIIDMYKLIKGD